MKSSTRRLSLSILPLLVFAVVAVFPPAVQAQSQAARSAYDAATDLYMQADYAAALAAYQQLLKDYPTDMLVPTVTVQTGFANFFLGNFDEAIAILEKAAADATTPEELKPTIAAFLPQVFAARASALDPGDPGRKAAFETAISKFAEFIKQYPRSPQVESARYGMALSKFQIEDFDGVVADLEENLRQFAQSPTIEDSQNLLALALATMGSKELAAGDKGDRAKGTALYTRAKELLQGIIDKQSNLALVNDARFQLAEILFSEAAFAPEDERPALFAKAMDAYRAVAPNEEMIDLQEQLMAQFPERRRRVLANPPALERMDREIEREQRRLGELRAKPDMVATSRVKLGEIYFNQGDLNKARVVIRHVSPFLTKDEDIKRAQYFLTLSYILQNKAPEAVENYNAFQEKHKGSPMAQNLPLAMGNMFLSHPDPTVRNTDKAIQFFDESLEIYPDGALAGLTVVSKAQAQVNLGLMAQAEETFNKFLAANPTPDEAVAARMGLGDIYIRTQQWDKAIAAYQKVVEEFGDRPQAKDAKYWIAIATQQKGDNAAAIPLLQALIKDNPDAGFVPNVMYVLAGAKIASGDNDAGITTLAEIAEKFPDSAPAPFTYFQRAQLLTQKGKAEEGNALISAFIEKYPQSDRIFAAFDWLAQNAYRASDFEGSIAFYNDFVEKYPDDPNSAAALIRVSEYSKQWAESLGRFGALTTDEQAVWKERMAASAAAADKMIDSYPASELLPQGIQNLIAAQEALVAANLQTQNELEINLKTKAAAANDPAIRSKILFGLASWLARQDAGRALETMREAFDPAVTYAPSDLDTYGMALLNAGEVDEAETIFNKMLADYPNPAGVEPQNAPPLTQHAQANSLFGLARIAQERGQSADAAEKFTQLKSLYAWSPKVLEADLGIAQAEVEAGQLDNALARLPGLIRSPNATAEVRAKAMLLGGEVMEKRMAAASADPKARDEALGAAIDYYIKIDQFYSGVPSIASEGLWRGAQLLERQAAGATDQEFRRRQTNLARRSYQDLINKYPNSPHVEAARARVAAMGG